MHTVGLITYDRFLTKSCLNLYIILRKFIYIAWTSSSYSPYSPFSSSPLSPKTLPNDGLFPRPLPNPNTCSTRSKPISSKSSTTPTTKPLPTGNNATLSSATTSNPTQDLSSSSFAANTPVPASQKPDNGSSLSPKEPWDSFSSLNIDSMASHFLSPMTPLNSKTWSSSPPNKP